MSEYSVESSARVMLEANERIRVLHVDDDLGFINLTKRYLELEAPFLVDTALSVDEAWTRLEKDKYDVIVSDYQMPSKDGLEFLKKLREGGSRTPFIIFTGKGRKEVAIRALNLGADLYLSKEGDTETVYAELSHHIKQLAATGRSEERRRESDERFRNIFEKAYDGLILVDLSGGILDINQKAVEIAEKQKQDIVGKSFLELGLVNPEAVPLLFEKLRQTSGDKEVEPFELEVKGMNGKKKTLEIRFKFIQKDNKPVGSLAMVRDITQFKRAEETLKESEAKYRSLIEQSMNGILIAEGPSPHIAFVNKTMTNILGYTAEELCSFSPRQIEKMVPNEDRNLFHRYLKERLEGKDLPPRYEVRAIRKDGNVIWLEVSSRLITYERQTAVQMMFADVTERKKAEQALRESEERFSRLSNASFEGIGISEQGKIIDVNNQLAKMLGYESNELIGRAVLEIVAPESRELVMTNVRAGYEGPYEHLTMRKDGSVFPVEIRARSISYKGRTARVSAIRDNTERKEAETALKESEAKYRSLVEQSLQGIIVATGPEPRGVFVNEAMTRIFGYTREEFYSFSPKKIAEMIHPEDRETFFRNFKERVEGKDAPSCYEVRGVRKDGSIVWLEVSSRQIMYEGQKAVQAIFYDITERKKTEQELRCFSTAVKASLDGIITGDLNGNIEDVNEATLRMYSSADKRDLIGKSVQDLLVESDRERARQNAMETLRTGQGKTVEYKALTKNGIEVPIEVTTELLRDEKGSPRGFVDIVRDLSEHKNQQRLLEESQKKFEALFTENPEAAAFVDEKYRVVNLNPAFTKLFGFTLEDLKGRDIRESLVPEGLKQQMENATREAVQKDTYSFDTLRKRKDGSCVRVSLSLGSVSVEGKLAGFIGVYKSIEEAKAYEEKLQRSSEEWRRTFDSISDQVFILDTNFNLLKVNKATCDALKKEASELIGKRCFEVVHGTSEPWRNCPCRKTFNTRAPTTEEINDPNLGIPLLVTVSPILDGKGDLCGVVHISKEITNRKKQEMLLLESQQRFAALFSGNPEATVFVDTDMHILDVNPRFTSLFEYSLDEIKGKHINDVVVPENLLEEGRMLDKKAAEGYVYHDTVRKMKDGSLIPVSVSAAPIYAQDKLTGYVWLYKDISQQKTAEESLKESEERFKALFAGGPEAAVYLGPDFHIRDVNPRFEQLFGYSSAEIKGKHLDDTIVQEGNTEEATMLNEKAVEGYVYHDTVRRRKDGSLVPVSISAAPIMIKGQLVGIVGIYKDISDLKNAEKKLADMNEKLRVVGGLTRHDVRNKLSIVTGNAYLMKKKLKDHPEMLESIKELESACETIVHLLEFARDYERIGVEELTYMNVEDSIEKAVALLTNIDRTMIMNECHGLTVLADSLLSKLFYNLMDNSLKHGDRVTRIRIGCEKSEDELRLVYEDDGVGIVQEAKPKLFSEGYTTGKGSGYGLYLIRRMTEVYGWIIQETGTPEKGARFTMTIPRLNKQGKENYRARRL